MSTEEFGKDLNIVRDAVIAGRKVGADKDFWWFLGTSEPFFEKVVSLYKEELEPSAEDAGKVLEFLDEISKAQEEHGCPFPERESYYSRSSHSGHTEYYRWVHRAVSYLFRKSHLGEPCRELAIDLEKFLQVGYALSAVWSHIHQDGDPKWFHRPLQGGWVTFEDIWSDDNRTPCGWFLNHKLFQADPLICGCYAIYKVVGDEPAEEGKVKELYGALGWAFAIISVRLRKQCEEILAQ